MGRSSRQPLHRSSPNGLDMVVWRNLDGSTSSARAGPALKHTRFDQTAPIRTGAQWQNRRNRHGDYFWWRTDTYVWHESALERAALLELDFAGSAASVAAQPLRMLFRRGAEASYHDPDYFAIHTNGDQVLYDVKLRAGLTPKVTTSFAETERICALIGWRHVVLHESSRARVANLEVLRRAQDPRHHPNQVRDLLHIFRHGRSLREGRRLARPDEPPLAMPGILHLAWHGHLIIDLEKPLQLETIVRSSSREATCCN